MSVTLLRTQERRITRAVRAALLSATFLSAAQLAQPVMAAPQSLASVPQQHYDIPAGPLGTTLSGFAAKYGIALSFDPALTNNMTNPPVAGTYSAHEVIARLLSNSNLELTSRADGSYTLHKPQSNEATLPAVTVKAASTGAHLPEVAAGGQVASGARIGLLGNRDVLDTPFNQTTYTAKLIEDQNSATLTRVLENDPSIRFTTSAGHIYENYSIRGFEVTSANLGFNGLYGIAPDAQIPTEMIERVEVLKGPGALLDGMTPGGSVGGNINVVTKRAGATPLTRLTGSWESGSQFGVRADISRRFGEEQRLGVRVNGGMSDGKTAIDGQSKNHKLGAITLDYQGENWNAQLDAYSLRNHIGNGSSIMVSFSTLGRIIDAPNPTTNAFRGIYADQNSDGMTLRGELNINRDWSVYGAFGYAEHTYKGYLNGTRVVLTAAGDGSAVGQTYHQSGYTKNTTAEVGIRGKFTTGSVNHQVVLSANTFQQNSGLFSPVPTSASYITNIYAPIVPLLPGSPGEPVQTTDNVNTSLALADALSFANDRVQLMLGVRAQNVKQKRSKPTYDQTALTPAVGFVVKPWSPNLSLYANYIEGLSAGSTVGDTFANAGETFAPYKTKQGEVGVKWQQNNFTQTVSLYQITKPSLTTTPNNYRVLDGEQRNRGLEWNVFGELTPAVRALGGVAYTEAKQTKTQGGLKDGLYAYGVPRWTANLGTEWDTSFMKNLTLTARAIYTGAQWANSANTVQLPSATRVDLGARYVTSISGKNVVVRGTIDNVFNRYYWSGTFGDNFATVGAPRAYRVSVSVDL